MKKILLVRDYSGMMSQLALALRSSNFDVTLASMSDSFKGHYGCDVNLEEAILGNRLVDQYLNYIKLLLKNKDYDVVHLQTQFLGGAYSIVLIPIIALLRKKAKILTVSLAGDDYQYWKNGPHVMDYSPHKDAIVIDLQGKSPYYSSRISQFVCWYVEKIADQLIPACYDYASCHSNSKKVSEHVPFVWDVRHTPFIKFDNSLIKPIKIFHAISRKGFKGTAIILEALHQLKAEVNDAVEILTPEKIPYIEYKKCLADCDIFIDQCNSYSYGMAAVEALALGKIVLSGAEAAVLQYSGALDCPIINIKPDSEDILIKLRSLLSSPNRMELLSQQSRDFAMRFHSLENVIPKYEKIWFDRT